MNHNYQKALWECFYFYLFIVYVFAYLSNWFSMFSFIIIFKIYLSACF